MASQAPWPCAAISEAELGPRTTIKVGGSVEWLLEPAHPDEFVTAWRACLERDLAPLVLGGGANLLIADGRRSGVVITTERMSRVFRPNRNEGRDWTANGDPSAPVSQRSDDDSAPELVAWAGASMPGLVRAARELGWSGLEGLVGVPGHVGGGVAMNAGGRWGEMWDVVQSVRVLTPEGELEDRPRDACSPSYRNGNLGGAVVLGAVLRLEPANRLEIKERMRQYLSEKSAAQPVTERSSGCIFKNPDPEQSDGRSAGKLIDDCGGKGLSVGDAVVSPKHGNFIVNTGRARATDVLELIERVRRLVEDESGVALQTEVRMW